MVKNLPCNVGNVESNPGQGANIPHAVGQIRLLPNYLEFEMLFTI